jgi:hypothetical protein
MRKSVVPLLIVVGIGMLGLNVVANEKPTPEFQGLMKSNSTANGALRTQIPAKDYDGIAASAATLKENYAKIEAFWVAKKVEDAIALAKTGAKGAADLEAAAKAKNDEAIAAANKTMGSTCAGCHSAHREQLPDKSFEIK